MDKSLTESPPILPRANGSVTGKGVEPAAVGQQRPVVEVQAADEAGERARCRRRRCSRCLGVKWILNFDGTVFQMLRKTG